MNSVLVPGKDVQSIAVPFTALPPGTTDGEPQTIGPDGRNIGWEITDLKVVAARATQTTGVPRGNDRHLRLLHASKKR